MKKAFSVILSVVLMLGSVSASFPAGASALSAAAESSEKVTLFVEFNDDAVLDKADVNTPAAQSALNRIEENRVSPLKTLAQKVKNFSVMYSYTHVLNGVAFKATRGDIEAIEDIGGVKAVYEISGVKPVFEKAEKCSAEGFTSTAMTGADALHEMGYDGTGTAVAVIDGGLDVNHEAMALTDNTTAKINKSDVARVIKSGINAQNATADSVYKSAKVPFAYDYLENDTDTMDDNNSYPDHGTHVSGIVAGNCDALTGIAPEAQILIFKIDVYDDDTFLANLLAAIDDAAKFDIAAINMSVGMDCESRHNPAYQLMNEAITVAHNNGITVCSSAGNSDKLLDDTANLDNAVNGIPNSLDDCFSIASVDNTALQHYKTSVPATITTASGSEIEVYEYNEYVYKLPYGEEIEFVPLYIGVSAPSLSGKYALIFDTGSSYSTETQAKKYIKMLSDDVAGIILSDDLLSLYEYIEEYPVFTVNGYDAKRLSHFEEQTVTVNAFEWYVEPAAQGTVSYFTSYGVNEDLTMAVDIAAPGGNIFSSVTCNQYDVYSGTSMSSPHVAGGAALMNQYLAAAYPSLSGKALADFKENLLMSTADPVISEGAAVSPRRVGAGLMDLTSAVQAKAILLGDNGKTALNIGDNIDNTFDLSFTVKNIADVPVTYDTLTLDVVTDSTDENTYFDSETGEFQTNSFLNGYSTPLAYHIIESDMPDRLTVNAGESVTVTLTVKLDDSVLQEKAELFKNGFYVEGYATLSDSTAEQTDLSLPFMGFRGDWLALPAYYVYEDDYFGETDIYAIRTLSSVTYELLDANGQTVASAEDEYVVKGDLITPYFDLGDADEGIYTIKITMWLEADTDRVAPQVYTVENYRLDFTCRVTGFNYKTEDGVRYILTVTSPDDDIAYIQLSGCTWSTRNDSDYIEFDGPSGKDDNGNYIYTAVVYGINPDKAIVTVGDKFDNTVEYGSYSFFTRLYRNFIAFLRRLLSGLDYVYYI